MSILTSKFDVLRGYPNGSALTWPFPIHVDGGVAVTLPAGTVVDMLSEGQTDGSMDVATSPDLSTDPTIETWIVVEGNDDFSGQFVGKCACVKLGSGVIWETDQYEAGTYAPGTAVKAASGKVDEWAATKDQIIGYVIENRISTKGTLVISS